MVNETKLRNLILHFVTKITPENLGKTKLFKLIFFVDLYASEKLGRLITGDVYLKYPMGPIPKSASGVIRKMNEAGQMKVSEELKNGFFITTYKPLVEPDMNVFPSDEIEIIGTVLKDLGGKSRGFLINLSHKREEWIKPDFFEEVVFTKGDVPSHEIFIKEYGNDMRALSSE